MGQEEQPRALEQPRPNLPVQGSFPPTQSMTKCWLHTIMSDRKLKIGMPLFPLVTANLTFIKNSLKNQTKIDQDQTLLANLFQINMAAFLFPYLIKTKGKQSVFQKQIKGAVSGQ